MEIKIPDLYQRIEVCRELCISLSKNSGITKALDEIISKSQEPEARDYLKSILENQFKQLMIDLNILTLDSRSHFRIEKLVQDFEKKFGGKLKKLGLDYDIKNEEEVRNKLSEVIKLWDVIRNTHAAHKDFSANKDWQVNKNDISSFIASVSKIINTMIRTMNVPQVFADGKTKSVFYLNNKVAVNLEEESYNTVLNNLKWINSSSKVESS